MCDGNMSKVHCVGGDKERFSDDRTRNENRKNSINKKGGHIAWLIKMGLKRA